MKNYRFIVGMLCVLAFLEVNTVAAQNAQSYFKNFPIGADPAFVGKKMSERLMETKHQLYGDRGIHYAEVCTWYGALRFAEATKDQGLINKLRNRFELLFHIEKELLPPPIHVDQNMFGCLPLKLYRLTKDERYKELGLPYADTQWVLPQNANETEKKWHKKGYSWQTRLWIDDMYMITIVQAEAYHVTGDKKYINRAAEEMGFDVFRLSMNWSRILQNGDDEKPNKEGLAFYDKVFDECAKYGIEPLVTLFHYETPLSLITRFGGWKDRHLIDAFVHYSDIVMNHYKGKVRYWLTFNKINAMDMAPYMGGGLIDGSEQNRAQGAHN